MSGKNGNRTDVEQELAGDDALEAAGRADDEDELEDDDDSDDDSDDDDSDDDESDADDEADDDPDDSYEDTDDEDAEAEDASGEPGDEPGMSADAGAGDAVPPRARGGADGDGEGDDDASDETADAPPLRTILESVLFAAAEPVPLNRLVKLLGAWPRATVKEALDELGQSLIDEGRGIRLAETAGGVQLRSASECAPWVRRFFAEKPPRLSRAVLETLAIVAYRQPATRGEVEAVRGVNCDAVLGALLTRNLIHVVGRRQSPGRPVEYGTTEAFLELFSLKDLSELPDLPEPEALARLIQEAEAREELTEKGDEGDANPDGENPEDLEPGGDRVAAGGGGPDPGGEGPAEREGDLGARNEGGPEQG
jgi:segregation and condensation protein B